MCTIAGLQEVPERLVTQETGTLLSEVNIPPAKTPISVDCAEANVESTTAKKTNRTFFKQGTSQRGEFTAARIIAGDVRRARHPIRECLPNRESVIVSTLLWLGVVGRSNDPKESIGLIVYAGGKEQCIWRTLRRRSAGARHTVREVERP